MLPVWLPAGSAFAAEDLLYQLCVEVNPQLDIHTVKLRDSSDATEAREAREIEEGLAIPSAESARKRLGQRARGLDQRLAERIIADTRTDSFSRCKVGVHHALWVVVVESNPQ